MRRFLAGTGRVLITLGLLILGFVAYQLWGTGVVQARAQSELEDEFNLLLADLERGGSDGAGATTSTTTSTEVDVADLDPTVGDDLGSDGATDQELVDLSGLPQFEPGDPLGRITIDAAGVDEYFVVGVSREDLKKGPGHYPGTPVPGSTGLSAIAGHRTTYGAPFFDLDKVSVRDDPDNPDPDGRGDTVVTETLAGTHVYEVIAKRIVSPDETWVASPVDRPIDASAPQTAHNWVESFAVQQQLWNPDADPDDLPELDPDGAYLVLTTCNPRYSAAQRLVVFAQLTTDERDEIQGDDAVTVALPGVEGGSDALPGSDEQSSDRSATLADLPSFDGSQSFEDGLGGDPSSLPPAIAWGLAGAAVGLAWWWAFRRWRHPLTWFAGFPVFALMVIGCYFYVERLLPSGY